MVQQNGSIPRRRNMALATVLLGLGALVTWRLSAQFGRGSTAGHGHAVAIAVAPIER